MLNIRWIQRPHLRHCPISVMQVHVLVAPVITQLVILILLMPYGVVFERPQHQPNQDDLYPSALVPCMSTSVLGHVHIRVPTKIDLCHDAPLPLSSSTLVCAIRGQDSFINLPIVRLQSTGERVGTLCLRWPSRSPHKSSPQVSHTYLCHQSSRIKLNAFGVVMFLGGPVIGSNCSATL